MKSEILQEYLVKRFKQFFLRTTRMVVSIYDIRHPLEVKI